MALGATATRVTGLMVQSATRPVALGVAAGLLGAVATTRLVSAMLFGVQPFDPVTFGAATALFALVAFAAAALPAARAASIDPVVSLRAE